MADNLDILQWLMALLPVIAVLTLMMVFRWSGGKAGALSWFIAVGIAYFVFGGNLKLLAVGSLKGLWTTVFILYIIWGAMALFNIVEEINGFEVIADKFTALTGGNRLLQLLVVGWGLTSFIQGVTGFGTPVVVAALLLVGLGFDPVIAAAASLLGHAWAVTFGSLGSSYGVLVQLTELSPEGLAFWSSIFLGISCILTGIGISSLYNGWQGIKRGFPAVILMGSSMALTLILTAVFVLPYIASLVAGVVGLLVGAVILPRTPWYKPEKEIKQKKDANKPGFHVAFAPYYLLLGIVFGVYLTPLNDWLSGWQVGLSFPRTETALGFVNEAVESYSSIALLTTPGTLIFISSLLAVIFYKKRGLWKKEYWKKILGSMVKQAVPSTVTVMTMSMMSVVMMEAGMINYLARGTARMAQNIYPLVSPFIGILGTFMTGSNTSSNILFSALQRDVAEILGINSLVIAALQTTGGAAGKIICPMTVALSTGVTGIVGKEGEIIKKTILYALAMGLVSGIIGYLVIYIV
ncbi:MAG: L-lactate permease [Halanaerobiales bacterium]